MRFAASVVCSNAPGRGGSRGGGSTAPGGGGMEGKRGGGLQQQVRDAPRCRWVIGLVRAAIGHRRCSFDRICLELTGCGFLEYKCGARSERAPCSVASPAAVGVAGPGRPIFSQAPHFKRVCTCFCTRAELFWAAVAAPSLLQSQHIESRGHGYFSTYSTRWGGVAPDAEGCCIACIVYSDV